MQLKTGRSLLENKSFLVILSGALCTLIMIFVMKLWHADINYLFIGSGGDSVLELMGIQNMVETGSRNLSERLGGIGGQQLYDYPSFDSLNYGIMWIFGLFTKNPAAIMNFFFLATFPLAAMTAMFALLELGISRPVSLFTSLLYPFMPYHFLRNQNHLLLVAYYMVPLAILVVLWLMQGESDLSLIRRPSIRESMKANRNFLLSILFCIMISSTGIYYAYFTCFFLLLAIVINIFKVRGWNRNSSTGAIYLLTITAGAFINYIPTIIYHLSGGEKAAELIRPGESAEVYGLKLIDLFMPTIGHQVDYIRYLVTLFHASEPTANENTTVSLGVLGSLGFLLLLILPIIHFRKQTRRVRIMKDTSIMAYAGFILATQGGVSALICRLLFSGIRAYNRIVVFLFFLALISIAIFIDSCIWGRELVLQKAVPDVKKKRPSVFSRFLQNKQVMALGSFIKKRRKWLCIFLVPLLMCALFDQIPNNSVMPYDAYKMQDQATQAYFQKVEASVPQDTYVYQLPFVEFPEPYTSYGTSPYSQLAGYINTKTLRWSYGALGGTSSSDWAQKVSVMPAEEMLAALRDAGYGAIYFDLLNYPDTSLALLKDQLANLTGSTQIVSEDGQKVFIAINN